MFVCSTEKGLHVTGIPQFLLLRQGSGMRARMEEFLMSEMVINNVGMAIGILVISILMLVTMVI